MNDSLDLIVGRRLTADEVATMPTVIRELVYLSWDADNTATATLKEWSKEPGRLRCCQATRCERVSECAAGRLHNEPMRSGKCYDVKPYVSGGVQVWDEVAEANAPRQGCEAYPAPRGSEVL